MKESLALPRAAAPLSGRTVFLQLGYVARHGLPSLDLSNVIECPAPHPVAAVPLEPPPWILMVDPPFFIPVGKRF